MAIIDVVNWAAPDDVYAWKHPSDELSTWTQLIVAESQEAVLLKEGQMIGPFKAGRHTLDTGNFPLLSTLFKIPMGGKSPFTAAVWFVNRTMPLDVRWGTPDAVQLQDPQYNIMLPVRAYGQYGVQVSDTRKFLIKLVGTMTAFDRAYLISYFRGIILTRVKDTIAKFILQRKVSVLEISAHLSEISEALQAMIQPEIDEFGFQLIRFTVNSISVPEDDPAVAQLKDALAKRAAYGILGTNIQQQRSLDIMSQAASNQGAAVATPIGAAMGMAMGVNMGNAMAPAMAGIANVQAAGEPCPSCRAVNPPRASFCSSCGTSFAAAPRPAAPSNETACSKCGRSFTRSAKFCPHCGNPYRPCPRCAADNAEAAKTCRNCGDALPVPCRKCGTKLPPSAKFCLSCGASAVSSCGKCGQEIPPDARFCPNCGSSAA